MKHSVLKKLISTVLTLCIMISTFAMSASAYVTDKVDSNGVLTFSGVGEIEHDLNYPPWWYDHYGKNIKTVIIEEGVTGICGDAFVDCTNLTSVKFPTTITNIPSHIFSSCPSLETVIVASGNKKYHSEDNCIIETATNTLIAGGKTSVIPDYVTSIGEYAFSGRKSLTSITVPDSVTSIGDYAFYNCTSLTDVYYGGTAEEWNAIAIGSGNAVLTNNIRFTGIYSGVCGDNLTWLYSDGLLTISGDGAMNDYDSSGAPWYGYRMCIKSVVIEDGVTSIGTYAFNDCDSITSIEIPDTVTNIGEDAFRDCIALTTARIPYGVPSIGNNVFYGCSALTSIEIPETVTTIGDSAFRGCTLLDTVEIPDTVTSMGDYAFRSCKSITSIKIPYGVESIGFSAFSWCEALASIDIPDTVTSIGEDAFRGCIALTEIKIPDGVPSIGNNAFRGCSTLASIEIPDTVTSIGNYAFSGCTALTSIEIPDTVTSIGNYAFSGCTVLTSIEIPDTVTSIGNYAFNGCTALTSIEIPDTVISIGDYAFGSCIALTDVYYGGTKGQWNKISLGKSNNCLTNAEVHFAEITFTVSGTVKSFGDAAKDIAIELLSNGEVVDTKAVTGNSGTYTFEDVRVGTYTVRVSKTKHTTREYEVTVADTHVTQDAEIWLYGDATGDGSINNVDILHINRKTVNLSSLFSTGAESDKEYRFKVANVTGVSGADEIINSIDILHINRRIAYLSSIFDKIA